MLKKWSCVSVLLACLASQTLSARNIFVTSPDAGSATLSLFTTEPLGSAGTLAGPQGATSVIAGPADKFYVLGGSAAAGITVLQGTFPSLTSVKTIPLPAPPSAAVLSSDGRRLVVTLPGGVQIIDTANDTALTATTGLNLGTATPSAAISADGRRGFVAVRAQRRVLVLNLENGAAAGEIAVEGEPSYVTVGPNTLVYVSVRNAVYEYHPASLELRGTFSVNGQPGPVIFTPDGRLGIATNELLNGKSAFTLDLVRRTAVDVPLVAGLGFDKIIVGDNAAAYALSSQTKRIYYINLLSPSSQPTFYNVTGTTLLGVVDIALTNESPQSKSLLVLTESSLYRVDLAENTYVGPLAAPAGRLSFAPSPVTGQAATLLPINSTQTLSPGATSLPLRVRAVNAERIPVSGVTVTFTTTVEGVTLSVPSAVTDVFGYAQTVATVPATLAAGVVNISAAASGQTASFSLTITGNNNPGPGPGPEPTLGGLQIVSGQGQVVSVGFGTNHPMTVRFVDAAGKPVAGVPLSWTVTQGGGALGNASTVTDENGIGTAHYSAFFVQFQDGYAPSTIAVSAGNQTVNFLVTALPNLLTGQRGEAQFVLLKPTSMAITARAGDILADAIRVNVSSWVGGGIPNVGMRLEPVTTGGATASCKDNTALSVNTGDVSCDVIAGSIVGDNLIKAIVGETAIYTFSLRVEPGLASNLRILSGNNQSGSAGQTLSANLVVQVTDGAGNALPGQTVTWEPVAAGSATLNPATSTTDENGRASTRVTLGQQPGLVQIRARSGSATVTFSITAQAAGSQLNVTSGGNQSAAPGQQFAAPVTVTLLNNQNQPMANETVQFAVSSGSATVPATAQTNASGVASVNVTAGAVSGPVVIRATYGSLSQNINLSVNSAGPVFTAASIVNAAGYQPGIAPGSIVVINASGIARDVRGSVTPTNIVGPLPTTLAGVEVLFNNVPSPIYSVSNINGQESVNVQVPFETSPGNTTITIRVAGGGQTSVSNVPIQAVKPGLFDFIDTNGRRYAVALRPDGSYVSSSNPARRGETIRLFATGMGQTNPATGTNRPGGRDQFVSASVIAGVNGRGTRLVSAKLLEGAIGVYIVEIEIPADETAGISQPVGFGVAGPDGVYVHAAAAVPIQ